MRNKYLTRENVLLFSCLLRQSFEDQAGFCAAGNEQAASLPNIHERIMETANNTSVYGSKPWLKRYDYWVPAEVTFPTQPIYYALNLSATLYPDQPATAFLGAKLTFKELKTQADKLATAHVSYHVFGSHRVSIHQGEIPNSGHDEL